MFQHEGIAPTSKLKFTADKKRLSVGIMLGFASGPI